MMCEITADAEAIAGFSSIPMFDPVRYVERKTSSVRRVSCCGSGWLTL
jgi:hypothetical protein